MSGRPYLAERISQLQNMELPTTAPMLDMRLISTDETSGKAVVEITNLSNIKRPRITREYDTLEKARKMALFIADTMGINDKDKLDTYLSTRGFQCLTEQENELLIMARQTDAPTSSASQ